MINRFQNILSILALVAILIASFALMFTSSLRESAIMDELAHIPAGYGYVRYLDYRLNAEHPPLVKALSALPLLVLQPNFPTQDAAWVTDINGQWAMGTKFLYESGNNADLIIQLSRIAPILLTLLLVILVYIWASKLLGPLWALLPTFLLALSPTVLAHGHYVTTDLGAALGVVLATYAFLKLLEAPSRKQLMYAGLAFGIAMLMKFSTVLLIPFFAALALFHGLITAPRDNGRKSLTERFTWRYARPVLHSLGRLIALFAIGCALVIYPVYALFTWNYPAAKQASDTEFILTSFAGGPTPPGATCKSLRCAADLTIWMTKQSATRPLAEYALGVLMVLQRSAGGNTAYFLGEVSAKGSPWYFPIVYALKEPLAVLIMVLAALALTIRNLKFHISHLISSNSFRLPGYFHAHFTPFAMLLFVILYWVWSIQSPLNIGVRHLMPTMPFIYILTAGVWKRWLTHISAPDTDSLSKTLWGWVKIFLVSSLKRSAFALLLVWFALSVAANTPYFLSYFNELAGGTGNGYRYVTDSNYDWGQDLLRLKQWVEERSNDASIISSGKAPPTRLPFEALNDLSGPLKGRTDDDDNIVDRIAVDYFGGGSPRYYLGEKAEGWWSSRGDPRNEGIRYLAVSVNTLQSAMAKTVPGFERKPEDEYSWLRELRSLPQTGRLGFGSIPEPDYRAGTSIFIYDLMR